MNGRSEPVTCASRCAATLSYVGEVVGAVTASALASAPASAVWISAFATLTARTCWVFSESPKRRKDSEICLNLSLLDL